MNFKYNFDKTIDRRGTDATQYEELNEKFGRTDLLPLWIADMDFPVCPAITEAVHLRADHPVFGYTHPTAPFWDSILSWLGNRHGWKVTRDEIDFVPGVKKGIGLCVNYFTRPGDRIVIQPPVYHSFRSVITGNGRAAVDNPLVATSEGYRMDLEGLEEVISREKPAMMIVCNPHNPIGIQWDAETLRRVAGICREHNVILLSDEIYGDLVLGGRAHIPTASVSEDAETVTVTIGAPSKSFNIPGLASAWVVVKNPSLRKGFFDWLLASEFDTPPLFAITATRAAYENAGEWLDEILCYLQANADFAMDFLARIPGVSTVAPEAGFGLWIDFRNLGLEPEELRRMLVDEAHVAVSDGATFGPGGEGFVRLNFGVSRSVLQEGLSRIANAISELKA